MLVEEQITDPAVGFDNFELLPLFSANPCTLLPDYSKLLVEIVLPSYANLVDVNLGHIVNNFDTTEDFDWPFFNAIVGFASKNHIQHVKNHCKFDVNLILIEKLNQVLNVKSVLPVGCQIAYETSSLPECSIQLPIADNLATVVGLGLQVTAATDQNGVCELHELDEVFLYLQTYSSFYACDHTSFLEFSAGQHQCTLCRGSELTSPYTTGLPPPTPSYSLRLSVYPSLPTPPGSEGSEKFRRFSHFCSQSFPHHRSKGR